MASRATEECKTILVVDDDEQILIVWRGALEGQPRHWHVVTARSGDEALDRIGTTAFDLIVTDLRLPGMDGCDLTVAIRHRLGNVPVIWITAYPHREALARSEALAVRRLLHKPLTVAQIREAVAQVLEDPY
jgi:CheY-like chemotaxis protein